METPPWDPLPVGVGWGVGGSVSVLLAVTHHQLNVINLQEANRKLLNGFSFFAWELLPQL